MKRKRYRYLYRLTLIIFLMLALPVILITWFFWNRSFEEMRKGNEAYYEKMTESFMNGFNRELTELKEEREDFTLASAYIITWDSNDWTSSFTINKGSGSGITVDMVAMTAQGEVVGLVTEVGSNWATVTTVLDSALEISANISSSGYAGMVQGAYTTGAEGMLRMDYLPTDAVIRNQEQVVTAGSTLYPRDLILGYVADAGFDETGVAKYALLTPAADFENLEQVFILTHYVHE